MIGMASNRRAWFGAGLVTCALVVSQVQAQESDAFAAALQMYLNGNYAAGESVLRPQMDQGDAQAMSLLAFMQGNELVADEDAPLWKRLVAKLSRGRLIATDPAPLLRRAADLDDPEAQFSLATILIAEDLASEEGIRLLKKASAQGHPEAPYFLGLAFALNGAEAEEYSKWFELAHARGRLEGRGTRVLLTRVLGHQTPREYTRTSVNHRFDGVHHAYTSVGISELARVGRPVFDQQPVIEALMWVWLGDGEQYLTKSNRERFWWHEAEVAAMGRKWLAKETRRLGTRLAAISAWCHNTQQGERLMICLRAAPLDEFACRSPFFSSLTVEGFRESKAYDDCRSSALEYQD